MKSLRTFTCSRSSRSNELIKVSQQSLTNQVITFDLIGKQWPLDTLIEWNARVENSKSFRSTLKPQEGLSLNDCQHATCLDNSSECSSDIKMLLTSVLWRRGPGGGTPYICHTGMCGLYGWVFSCLEICRNGVIFTEKSVDIRIFLNLYTSIYI